MPSDQHKNSYYEDKIIGLVVNFDISNTIVLEIPEFTMKTVRWYHVCLNLGNSYTWKDVFFFHFFILKLGHVLFQCGGVVGLDKITLDISGSAIEIQWDLRKYPGYRQISNISRTFVGNEIVDHSDVVAASPVGAAPTTSSFST